MNKKMFLSTLALAVAVPVLAAPVPADTVLAKETQETVAAVKNPFKDISAKNTYYSIIHEMRDAGIIYGYEDNTFRPTETLSRKHAAVLVNRAMKINDLELEKTTKFVQPKDLSKENPYYQDLKTLMEAGLLDSDKNGNVNPNEALTRGEMSKILAVVFDLEVKADYLFEDVKGSEYEEYVKALYSNGVTTGYEDYTFKLDESLTRAHYAVFMYRAMNIDEEFEAKPIPKPETKPDKASNDIKVKYSDWSREDIITKIPRPDGYVEGKHEKENEKTVQEIVKENAHGFKMTSFIGNDYLSPDKIKNDAEKILGISYEEYVDIINTTISTGEVYNGTTFTIYYDYTKGQICITGVRNW